MQQVQPQLSERIGETVCSLVRAFKDQPQADLFCAEVNSLDCQQAKIRKCLIMVNSLISTDNHPDTVIDKCLEENQLIKTLAVEMQRSPELSGVCWELVELFVRVLEKNGSPEKLSGTELEGVSLLFCSVLINQRDSELLVWATLGMNAIIAYSSGWDNPELIESLTYNISQVSGEGRLGAESLRLIQSMLASHSSNSIAELFLQCRGVTMCLNLIDDSFASEASAEVLTILLRFAPDRLEESLNTISLLCKIECALQPGILYTNSLLRFVLQLIDSYASFAGKILQCSKLIGYLEQNCIQTNKRRSQLAQLILEKIEAAKQSQPS